MYLLFNFNILTPINSSVISKITGSDQGNVSQLIENFHAERFQLEAARDDYKLKWEHLEAENNELTERCVELQELASMSKRLQDEVDELNYKLTNTGIYHNYHTHIALPVPHMITDHTHDSHYIITLSHSSWLHSSRITHYRTHYL